MFNQGLYFKTLDLISTAMQCFAKPESRKFGNSSVLVLINWNIGVMNNSKVRMNYSTKLFPT